MKITSFNKNNLKDVRNEINKKLQELKELGLNIELGNISFNDSSFTSKITCTIEEAGDKFAIEFKRKAFLYGMSEDSVGKTFTKKW